MRVFNYVDRAEGQAPAVRRPVGQLVLVVRVYLFQAAAIRLDQKHVHIVPALAVHGQPRPIGAKGRLVHVPDDEGAAAAVGVCHVRIVPLSLIHILR